MRKLFSVACLSLLFVLICAALWYRASTFVPSSPTHAPIHRIQVQTQAPTPSSYSSLRTLGNIHHLLIGTAVNADALQHDSQYRQILADEFSEAVPENSMKMDTVETGPSHYNFTQADALVAFALAHHMTVHGHVLVWANTTIPSWLQHAHFTRQEAMSLLHDYITPMVTRYRHRVTSWDVASEILSPSGSLRPCYWLQMIGPSYIALAFQWAHEADPSAQLYYNDYGIDTPGQKSHQAYVLLSTLLAQHIPITGIGFEMHELGYVLIPEQVISRTLQQFASLGLSVSISELDVSVYPYRGTLQQKVQYQAHVYGEVLRACLSLPQCTSFTMWGFTDRYSWVPQFTHHLDFPLIFDENYQPKPAYYALIHLLS